jgi:hypothetical protein
MPEPLKIKDLPPEARPREAGELVGIPFDENPSRLGT